MDAALLIRGATVADGENPLRVADVAIDGGLIVAVAKELPTVHAGQVVEAAGLLLCPGFIDMHAHSALEPFARPELKPKVAQGFTTELVHPDGLAPAPVEPARRDDRRAYLVGLEGSGRRPGNGRPSTNTSKRSRRPALRRRWFRRSGMARCGTS